MSRERPRLRETGLVVGDLPTGPANTIADVPGVTVGHLTMHEPEAGICTGLTAILPHRGNLFRRKVPAAVHVANGFGKATGLVQIAELGTLETPVVLTNTLSVGAAWEGVVRWMLDQDREIGRRAGTVNPVVLECNDGYLNDIRSLHVRPEHVFLCLTNAAESPVPKATTGTVAETGGVPQVAEGAVGAGTGMICFGYKGGIGTSSRRFSEFTVGVLVLTNFGQREDLRVLGIPVGRMLSGRVRGGAPGGGSVIVVVATDAPLCSRQLRRLAARAVVGLVRVGSYLAHGSGDFVLAFSTAYTLEHDAGDVTQAFPALPDHGTTFADACRGAAEATEEAVLNSLFRGVTTKGRDGHAVEALPVEDVLRLLKSRGVC